MRPINLCLILAVLLAWPYASDATQRHAIKVIAFDAFPVFDPRPLAKAVQEMFPDKGQRLFEVWQTKQFAYTWLRTSGDQYRDFWSVTEDALDSAAKTTGVELSQKNKQKLMNQYLALKAWPDVPEALNKLKGMGYRLVFLSNFTQRMLTVNSKAAGIEKSFSDFLSTDLSRAFKPSPKAYGLAIERLGVKKEEVLFVPFAPWDASGAKWFGYQTFWVNRMSLPAETLGTKVDGEGQNLNDLIEFLNSSTNAKEKKR